MSFDKVEVRVFSGPDQVQVGSNTEPDLIVINNGPKGDPGAAATIAVGTTTTLSPGSSATVANAGTSSAAVFNFGIPTGATGATGASGGSSTAWRYRAKTNATSGYPTDGHLLWNNATQTSATEIIVSHLDDEGTDIELLLSFFLEGQKIFIQNRDDSSQNQVWEISGTPTVTGANTSTAYYTFPVTLVSSAGAAFTNNHSILFGSIAAAVNAVTSATTSDGTANLSIADLEVVGGEIYTDGDYSQIYTQGTDAHIFTLGAGAEIFTVGEVATIATQGANATISTAGAGATIGTQGANATIYTQGANATISTAGSSAHIQTTHASAAVKSTNFAAVESGGASLVDGSMQPCLTWSAGGRNLTIPSGTATTFNTTSYTYGTGAAAAHRTALGVQQLKAVVAITDESKTPNNTNYADDSELFLTLEAGTWLVECNAFWSNVDNTIGMRAQVAFDGTMDTTKSPIVVYSGSSNDSSNITTNSANSRPIGALTATMPRAVIVAATGRNGIIQTEHTVSVSVAGTYKLQFGQGTASPTLAVIRKAGSFIRATKLA